ncbi:MULTISPECIES: hypothetical protein [unclassified Streptomyces]|uniref:hypothetical protein n=1 Tax=unclassified Streptomyces TaxID=2593676 RepID=UPI0036EEBF99
MTSETPTGFPERHAEYLAEVEARQAAATVGDWGVYNQGTLVEVVAGLRENGTGYNCRRQIARLDEEPIDNIREHADWTAEQDYAQLLADAAFMAHARTDVPRLLDIIAEQHRQNAELAARLEKGREFRIPVANTLGGYGELTVERGPGPFDHLWAVTDGAPQAKRFWHTGPSGAGWCYLSDTGPALAYKYDLAAALALGEEAAAVEGARVDEAVRTARAEAAARQVTGGAR